MPKLRDFQREDVEFIKQHGLRVLIASAPGTGKTPVAIRSVAETYKYSLPALVVCPATVNRNWIREIRRWAPGMKTHLIENSDDPIPRPRGPMMYVISWSLLDARWADLLVIGIRTVIADEAHYAKNPDTQRAQALMQVADKAAGVMLLTGTPIVNTQAELAVLNSILGEDPPMIRRLLEDVAPDIPEKKRSYIHIALRPADRLEYDKADADFETWLRKEKEKLLGEGMAEYEVERALAAEALAKIGYLRRLAGVHKVPAACDWIARAVRIGEPVVVFVEHQNVLRKLVKGLRKQRIRHGVIDGSTSSKRRQELVDEFQRHEFPVFIGTKAAKEGITLTAARHLLFLERFFTAADEEQAEDRIRRIGQAYKTTIWFLHAQDTIDERVDTIVRMKRQVVRTAIGGADIEETPNGNVQQLLATWSEYAVPEELQDRQILPLGLGEPLPPLPRPKIVHAVVFYSRRWTPAGAAAWCKMNGYEPQRRSDLKDRFKIILNPTHVFVPNKFSVLSVSRDIRVIVGTRLSAANERRVRKSLKFAR